ncbi:DNA-directed RNA polymerase, beta subunit (macronuclear) [Tetrahymena thermophila SB210]|uniref:DNA-directed RNA polymerase n=2 Tax=Tetrahymena thermophila (strain SB210) TaxID=312017 RepID=Q22C56_TETTS|nr:DNA-directed RNA polymerase, beta subunit [Tetrahymena thermophila SB210]EAR82856.2 DNA-directed RNA polymerase, beta subunit [Tetrahymena thermophila SB210]|eukprot:XP_001030519.2 DNA-directed RNA polymerase, beta subunit [Tetrahymena thermophila SB210]
MQIQQIQNKTKIYLFGKLLFLTNDPYSTIQYLRQGRFQGKIPRYVTFEVQGQWNEILIYGDSGRMIRPLFVIETKDQNNQIFQEIKDQNQIYDQLIVKKKIQTWEQFLSEFPQSIEWCDIQEISNKLVSPSAQILEYNNFLRNSRINGQQKNISLQEKNRYVGVYLNFDLMEIHPINVLGINPSTIPYPHCNYAPRNIFAFVQMKRSVQKPYSDNDLRSDINQYLILGSAPLVQTMTTNMINTNEKFNGTNVCIAVLQEHGYQQEDSITISSRLAKSMYLQCKNGDVKNFQHDLNYEKLDENGLIREGSVVRKGDIVIGKILILNQEDQIIDRSIKFEYEEGIILKVKQINVDGQQKIIIRFIIPLYPQIGDKYAARCGQKGTIGTIRDENQMPYTNDGTPIDIIINPCSFSTRMTIGMNIEQYTSYLVLLTGLFLDSSMFCDKKIYYPLTGEFIGYAQVGFVFYAAQEQKAFSKLYAVGFNEAYRNQVFQPRDGAKNNGGSRLGEMEMAAFLSAGTTNVIKQFAWQHSDGFVVDICSHCGLYAHRDQNQQKYYCKNCNGKSEVVKTQIQYSSKHFKDLLNSLGMSIYFKPKQNI